MSSSTSTKNPTGPCAACEKEEATKRCRSCLDVGIDIFFCNRDCQLKHWKTHKAVCGNASTSNDFVPKITNIEEKVAKAWRKALKKSNQSLRKCYNCIKTEKDVKLSSCSGCDLAAYCSRECQKAHWPKHKDTCKENSAARQQMDRTLTVSEKNVVNLFNQWVSKPVIVRGILQPKFQQMIDMREYPPTKLMLISLEFDYNAKTFILAEEPSVIPISQCPQEFQDTLERESNQYNEVRKFHNVFMQYSIITCKDLEANCKWFNPMYFGEHNLNVPMKQLIEDEMLCKRIPLKSDLFDGWDEIRKSNLQKQIDYFNKSATFTGCLDNVMNFFNSKERLSVGGIVIYVKLGKELGQITNFVKYEDMPQSDFMASAQKAFPNSEIPKIPPHLQQSVIVAVAYKNIETDAYLAFDRQICTLNTLGSRTTNRYKKDANDYFKQLQELVKKMPSHFVEKVRV
ncbi:hypothetical protein CTEN210_10291 [Chaetoceros tenuissimus]|uniref:MYND-type domain-containing protein n=1 Tax=Chaetoceros tenuissimus TaxID=426638 RepID=A0AAD3CZK2_9STRA|nr:hypothetical protein CTEN210_10291 [Chaetoceros tenuissimus]